MNNVVGDGLMNEKRFYLLSYKNYPIYDSVEDKEYNARFRKQREKLCDLLNEWVTECNQLQKENEQLRNEVAHWKHRVFSLLWILGQFDKDKVKELLKEIDDE